MKNKKLLSLILSFSTLSSSMLLASNIVQAETTMKAAVISQDNLSLSQQPTAVLDTNGSLKPLKLTMAKAKPIPGICSSTSITNSSNIMTATYIAPYSIIHTPLGDAMFLQQGCTDADSRANGWDSALQADLNELARTYGISGINLVVDGIYGSATASAVSTFQSYIKNSWGCSTMSIDGIAGNQTWTSIYALYDGYNPHSFIS